MIDPKSVEFTPELKEKWVAALRSGEYRQTTGSLKGAIFPSASKPAETAHCCLGVLCDVIDPDGWRTPDSRWRTTSSDADLHRLGRRVYGASFLPVKSDELFNRNDGGTCSDGVSHKPHSFEEIADYIEKNL